MLSEGFDSFDRTHNIATRGRERGKRRERESHDTTGTIDEVDGTYKKHRGMNDNYVTAYLNKSLLQSSAQGMRHQ